jgi:hypothetical protein
MHGEPGKLLFVGSCSVTHSAAAFETVLLDVPANALPLERVGFGCGSNPKPTRSAVFRVACWFSVRIAPKVNTLGCRRAPGARNVARWFSRPGPSGFQLAM